MYKTRQTPAVILGKASERGMTLLEILVVLAILATVTALLFGPMIRDALFESKVQTTKIMVAELANKGYIQWQLKNTSESCPENLNAIAKYTAAFDDATKVVDAWGTELVMLCGEGSGLPDNISFGVISAGEDKKRDTPDDIKSWESGGKKAE